MVPCVLLLYHGHSSHWMIDGHVMDGRKERKNGNDSSIITITRAVTVTEVPGMSSAKGLAARAAVQTIRYSNSDYSVDSEILLTRTGNVAGGDMRDMRARMNGGGGSRLLTTAVLTVWSKF